MRFARIYFANEKITAWRFEAGPVEASTGRLSNSATGIVMVAPLTIGFVAQFRLGGCCHPPAPLVLRFTDSHWAARQVTFREFPSALSLNTIPSPGFDAASVTPDSRTVNEQS